MTYGASPMAQQMPADMHDKIIHVRLVVGNHVLMGGGDPPQNCQAAQGFHVSITVGDPAEADRVFHELSKEGKVTMPTQKTFWSAGFGMTVDRFGTPWLINCTQAA